MSKNKNNKFKIDFIGIGSGHSATTWIFNCLKEHPQICGSNPKETKFFRDYHHKGLQYYKKFYQHCPANKIKGEFTPSYMYREKVAKRIKKVFPRIKLIVCLRNPIERLISQYLFVAQRGEVKFNKLENKILKDLQTSQNRDFIEKGLYYKYISKYLAIFPEKQILITIYEDIKKNPLKFIQQIYTFLGIDPNYIPGIINKKSNITAKNKRCIPILPKIYTNCSKKLNASNPGKCTIKFLKIIGVKYIINTILSYNIKHKNLKPIKKPTISLSAKRQLLNFYKEDIRNLENFLKRDLSIWR